MNTHQHSAYDVRNEVYRLLDNTRKPHVPDIDVYALHDSAFANNLFVESKTGQFKPRKGLRRWVEQNFNRFIKPRRLVDKEMTILYNEEYDDYFNNIDDDIIYDL